MAARISERLENRDRSCFSGVERVENVNERVREDLELRSLARRDGEAVSPREVLQLFDVKSL